MSMLFVNELTESEKVHYSRYIASWVKVNGHLDIFGGPYDGDFVEWLKTEGLSDHEINDIWNMATCGRLEQQERAKRFLRSLEEESLLGLFFFCAKFSPPIMVIIIKARKELEMANKTNKKRHYTWRQRIILVTSRGETKLSNYLMDLGIHFETETFDTNALKDDYIAIYMIRFEATRPMYDNILRRVLDEKDIVGLRKVTYYG